MTTQEKSTYTPGPWEWDWGHTDNLYGNGDLSRIRDDRQSGEYDFIASPPIIQTDNRVYGPNDADACLIAAAPDMLKALQIAADIIHDYHGDQTQHDGWQNEEVRDAWLAARAAIAKATNGN